MLQTSSLVRPARAPELPPPRPIPAYPRPWQRRRGRPLRERRAKRPAAQGHSHATRRSAASSTGVEIRTYREGCPCRTTCSLASSAPTPRSTRRLTRSGGATARSRSSTRRSSCSTRPRSIATCRGCFRPTRRRGERGRYLTSVGPMWSWGRTAQAIGRCSTGWGVPTSTGSTAS